MTEAQHTEADPDPLAGWTTAGPNGVTVLRLEEPVSLGGNVLPIEELRFARIRAKHLRAFKDDSTAGLLDLVEVVTSESRRVIDGLSVADAMRAIAVVARGFPSGLAPGAGS